MVYCSTDSFSFICCFYRCSPTHTYTHYFWIQYLPTSRHRDLWMSGYSILSIWKEPHCFQYINYAGLSIHFTYKKMLYANFWLTLHSSNSSAWWDHLILLYNLLKEGTIFAVDVCLHLCLFCPDYVVMIRDGLSCRYGVLTLIEIRGSFPVWLVSPCTVLASE